MASPTGRVTSRVNRITRGTEAPSSTNEVQRITFGGTVSGGSYKITFNGQQTGAITHSAAGGAITTALEALSNIAPGDVSVSGGGAGHAPVVITFGGVYSDTNVPQISVQSSLTGSSPTATPSTTSGGSKKLSPATRNRRASALTNDFARRRRGQNADAAATAALAADAAQYE